MGTVCQELRDLQRVWGRSAGTERPPPGFFGGLQRLGLGSGGVGSQEPGSAYRPGRPTRREVVTVGATGGRGDVWIGKGNTVYLSGAGG